MDESTLTADQHLDHLFNDETAVHVPYLVAGHYSPSDAAASPVVETLVQVDNVPAHPLNGEPMIVVALNDSQDRHSALSIFRMAHHYDACTDENCRRAWQHREAALAEAPNGASLSAVQVIKEADDERPELVLIVDVEDLDADDVEAE